MENMILQVFSKPFVQETSNNSRERQAYGRKALKSKDATHTIQLWLWHLGGLAAQTPGHHLGPSLPRNDPCFFFTAPNSFDWNFISFCILLLGPLIVLKTKT